MIDVPVRLPGIQVILIGPTPPTIVAVRVTLSPAQISSSPPAVSSGPPMSSMLTLPVAVQPLASVTVTLYVPPPRPEIDAEVAPVFHS